MLYNTVKCLGVGINYRNIIAKQIISNIEQFDFIEVNTERFFTQTDSNLHSLKCLIPITLHGLSLSLGTNGSKIPTNYLRNLKSTINTINFEWFSEHIGITRINKMYLRTLMPAEFSENGIYNITTKAKEIMKLSNKPFLLENITYYYKMPNGEMNELEFINRIIKELNCGLLLDLNNLYVNSINHRYNPYKFLDNLPHDNIIQIHLAGCGYHGNLLIDTHASQINKEVLNLFNYIIRKIYPKGVIIERDANLKDFNELIEEVKLIKNILKNNHKG